MADGVLKTTCCVVGGGPAGMMLGFLLARRGVDVTVLEKHADFFRDFRGDTVHPTTLEVLKELWLLDEFLKLPHQKVTSVGIILGNTKLQVASFRHVPMTCKFVALMPQWDFLNFLAGHAQKLPSFRLLMQHEATGLTHDDGRVTGVTARTEAGEVEIQADLVVGCDGRHSITRQAAGFEVIEKGVPMDVLWFRISRWSSDPENVLGNVNYGKALILIDRGDYFQAGLIIPKGSYPEIQSKGIDEFRAEILQIAPYLVQRVNELQDWDQIKILTVQINRLRKWHRPGLLCIGDAAHAMSPAGGVGINLAIQDAVAAANILAEPLRKGRVTKCTLAAVQCRRELPTRVTQGVQMLAHRGLNYAFRNPGQPIEAPWQAKAVLGIPGVQSVLGYTVGMGVRPEHVQDKPRVTLVRRFAVPAALAAVGMAATVAAVGWAAWKIWRRA